MNSHDRVEFDTQMKKLCHALGRLPAPDLMQAYFDGLEKMSLIQFGRVVQACLDEVSASDGKLPTVPQVWKIWGTIRDKARAAERPQAPPPSPPHSRQRRMITAFMFRYLYERRLLEKTKGNIDIDARTKAAEKLIAFLEASAAEDLMPTVDEAKAMFNVEMERIGDYTDAETA